MAFTKPSVVASTQEPSGTKLPVQVLGSTLKYSPPPSSTDIGLENVVPSILR